MDDLALLEILVRATRQQVTVDEPLGPSHARHTAGVQRLERRTESIVAGDDPRVGPAVQGQVVGRGFLVLKVRLPRVGPPRQHVVAGQVVAVRLRESRPPADDLGRHTRQRAGDEPHTREDTRHADGHLGRHRVGLENRTDWQVIGEGTQGVLLELLASTRRPRLGGRLLCHSSIICHESALASGSAVIETARPQTAATIPSVFSWLRPLSGFMLPW